MSTQSLCMQRLVLRMDNGRVTVPMGFHAPAAGMLLLSRGDRGRRRREDFEEAVEEDDEAEEEEHSRRHNQSEVDVIAEPRRGHGSVRLVSFASSWNSCSECSSSSLPPITICTLLPLSFAAPLLRRYFGAGLSSPSSHQRSIILPCERQRTCDQWSVVLCCLVLSSSSCSLCLLLELLLILNFNVLSSLPLPLSPALLRDRDSHGCVFIFWRSMPSLRSAARWRMKDRMKRTHRYRFRRRNIPQFYGRQYTPIRPLTQTRLHARTNGDRKQTRLSCGVLR
jgi:hypothetical protein